MAREYIAGLPPKSSYAWSHSVVCLHAWRVRLSSSAGIALVLAYPMAIAWAASSPSVLSVCIIPHHPDRCGGLSRSLFFAHSWSILLVVAALFAGVPMVRDVQHGGGFNQGYLVPVVVAVVMAFVITMRFLTFGIRCRIEFHRAKELGAPGLPRKDPTTAFLGEHWWKLPAIFLATAASIWSAYEWLLQA